jgi:hypothetical protein
MNQVNNSLSLSNPHPAHYNTTQKTGLAIIAMVFYRLPWQQLAWVKIRR